MHSYIALYRALNWATIRVTPQGKAPLGAQWQTRTDEPSAFAPNENVGVRLGEPSNNLVDVDLDCAEAVLLAPRFLPQTATFGRASKPQSHYLYHVDKPPKKATTKIGGVPLELRSTGGQTVFPPSTHESGEPIVWATNPPPTTLPLDELLAAWGRLTAATLLARADLHGQVHEAVLALSGALWHEGWELPDAAALLLPALELHNGADPGHREQAIRETWDDNGRNRYGWPKVAEILGDRDAKALQRCVELVPTNPRPGAGEAHGPLTDAGNAERFAADHGEDLRHCAGLGWLQWDGARWTAFQDKPYSLAVRSARKLQACGDPKAAKFGFNSENLAKLRPTLEIAEGLLRIDAKQLDADPWLLNTPSGVVNLRTGDLQAHDKALACTQITGVPYDPTIPTPRFDRFMSEIFGGDVELAEFVLRYLGQSLTGCSPERCLQVWYGIGSNGKSTLVNLLMHVLGDYARTLSIGVLLEQGRPRSSAAASPDLAALRGVRFAAGVETSEHQRWNESLIKQLTGGDKLTARFLYQREVMEFDPTWTLALATNHKPIVRGVDPAIWDRIHLVPFEVRFLDDGEPRKDPALHDTLRAEAPGILAKLVRYCIAWREQGLQPPERVLAEVQEYKDDQDTIGEFLRDNCSIGPGLSTPRAALWSAYSAWADEANEHKLGRKTFNQRIAGRFESQGKDRHARWLGVSCGSPAAVVRTAVERAKQGE